MVKKQICTTCGGPIEGYICDNCGQEMEEYDVEHSCGVEHCQPKCANCKKAEGECTC